MVYPTIRHRPPFYFAICASICIAIAQAGAAPSKPNIIVILTDDQGYADLGIQGSTDVRTPRIDSLAENGVRFTDGYVTSSQCGPSRAGLLTGRYQNRFGFESNEQAYNPGLPLDEPVIAEYSTDAYTREAVRFIQAHNKEQPFFVYLPYITPHVPMDARPQDLARFPDLADPLRRTMLAMMANLDDNVGWILDTLEAESLLEDTLIFFISDNGGYPGNASLNLPFSGTKTQMLEGGIRVPFIMQWPSVLPQGKVYSEPVISLDIVATSLTVAGVTPRADKPLDGTNLIPYLTGEQSGTPHDALYWRFDFPAKKPSNHG